MRAEDFLGAPAVGTSADDFLGPDPVKPGVTAKDQGLSLLKGIAQLPSAATSLADIPLAIAINADRPVSRAADFAGEVTGFQPKKWAEQLGAARSPGYQAQQQELSGAWDSSGANELSRALLDPARHEELGALWDKLDGKGLAKTIAQNPGAVGAMTLESLPSMVAGGAIGRGVKAGAAAAGIDGLAADTAKAAAIRAGIGEGAVTSGQVMGQIDSNVDPRTAAGASLAAGGITGLIGGASGRVATKLGIPDLEMALAGARTPGAKLSLLQRLPAAMVEEGLVEELPQSMQEQMWQNVAEGKPLGEGVLRQGVEGALAGMATGGAFAALPQGKAAAAPTAPAPTNAGIDAANQDVQSAMDAYLGPDVAGLLPDRGIQMPPPDGTLAAAAYTAQQMGAGQADPTAQLLRAYPTPEAAQAELEQRPDADLLTIVPHPRADSGYAVVRKSPAEIAQVQQSAQEQGLREAANQEAQTRQDQLAQEEEASRRESQTFKSVVDLNRNAAALEKSITEDTPAAQASTIRAQAAEMRTRAEELLQQAKAERQARTEAAAQASLQQPASAAVDGTLAQAQIGDAAQDELAPSAAQPVSSMPASQAAEARNAQVAQEQVQAANAAGQLRQDQLAQEEAPTVDEAAGRANTAPTGGQKEAGNYAKGHVTVGGLQIAIENPAGSSRSGVEGGKKWTTSMKAHYGYVKRTTGADGDQVDVYVKPGTKTDHEGPVFVVDQYSPSTGAFDEHKVLMGYGTQAEASKAYDAHFGDKSGPARRGAVTQMTTQAFKQWLRNGDTTAPVSSAKFGGQTASEADAAQEEIQQSGGRLSPKRKTEGAQPETAEQRLARRAAESNARKQQMAASAGLRSRADHEAAINTTIGIDDAQVVTEMSGANEAAAGEISKQQADFIRQVARLFKKKVVFFRSDKASADGAWRTNGDVIYLNSTSSVTQLRVLGHELVHAMRVQAPEAYEKMRATLADLLTDEQLAGQHQDYFGTELTNDLDKPAEGTGDQTLRDFLAEEWMADLSGNRFGEAKFWSDLFSEIEARQGPAEAKGIVAKLRMAISNAINQLLQVIKGGKFSADARLADNLDQIRAAVKDGFVAYEKAAKAGQLQRVMAERARQSAKRPESDIGHKRTIKGDYVGAPAKLGALRKRLFSLAKEGEPGRFWYEDSSRLILAAAEGDAVRAEKIAGLLAIYSPNATVSANTTMGLKALYQWMNGDPIKVRFAVQDAKAEAWMAGSMSEEDAMQIKTGNFFRNLMRKIDEERYGFEQQGATIDMWMARVFGYNTKAVGSSARYYFAEREVTRLANELGWEPQQVQAALWVAVKSRIEAVADDVRTIGQEKGWLKKVEKTSKGKTSISWVPIDKAAEEQYEGLMLKKALATGADPSGLTKAAYHFGTALRERMGQISWEAIPGKTTGVLPGIFEAPLAQQAEYLAAIDQALRDEDGQDLIAKKLGLPAISTAFGPSAWQMHVGAGAQTEVAIPVVKGEGVTTSARELLNTYAAIRGYVLAQEAVVWHYPVFDASKKNANGVQLDFGRDPTHEEVAQLYQAIYDESGRDDWAPAYVPGIGVRVLNFSDVPNLEFHRLVEKAVRERTDLELEGLGTFQSEGDYIGNDWVEHPDGAQYKELLNGHDQKGVSRGAGRSDLQGWVEGELRPRVERVNQDFSEKYGWGKVRFSPERASGETDESSGQPGVVAGGAPEFFSKSEQSSHPVVKFSAKRAAETIRSLASELADDFFRIPTTDATDMLQIAKELGGDIFAVKSTPEIDRRATQAWTLRAEGEKDGRRYHRDAYILQNQYGMVWVNVGALETGDQGGRIYQIAGAYAHNNGLRFIGDPDGITEAGKRRRLENMIGLALKYGNTKFLAPHMAMQGWNRLVWNPQSDDNLLAMLQASYNFVSRIYPEIKDVEFSLETGRFRRAGADLGRDDFEGMASELRGRLGTDATGAPGSGTLRLGALYASLVQEEDPEGRMGVLLADGDDRAELVRSLTEVRYSRTRTITDLSPSQEAAADRVLGAPRTFADRWQAFKQDWSKNLKQGIFDQFAPLLELDPKAYMLARLSKGGDSTLEALMLYGKLRLDVTGATDVDYTPAGGLQGFASKMAPLGQEQDRFFLWVAAQRADRLKQVGLENLWSDQDIRELSTLDQGSMEDGSARAPIYAQALADLNDFNDNVLSIAEGSGLISTETRQMYQDQPYVPFYRLQEEGIAGFGMKPGLVNQAAWKRLKGGTEKLNEDLLANVLKNWSHLITASARNRAARASLEAAERVGAAAAVPSGTPGQDLVRVRVQGTERTYAVVDPHLLDAVAALEYAGLGPWSRPLTAAKHWLTIGVTANPTFKLRNLMRDSVSAIGSASLSYNPAKNIGQGWGSTAMEAETRAHMLAAGGMIRFGSMLDGNSSHRAQELIDRGVDPALILDSDSKLKDFWTRRVRPALDAYNELGDRVENINRAALYDQLIAKGMSHMEASYWARDLMDFSMSGKWTAIRGLVQVVPFFNARLQGLYKLGRAGTEDIRRLGTVLGTVSLFSLALLFAAKGDDDDWKDWQARTDEDRNNYWWFKVGGLAFRVPKPFEIGAVGTIAERGYEIMADDEMTPKRFGKVMSQIVLSQLSMNPTPQLFKPMMDLYANQDGFTGMPIEGPALQGLRKEDRYDDRTSGVARFLGGLGLPNPTQLAMGRWDTLSPKQIDYLARGYFSWLATMATTALDYGIRPMIDAGDRPTRTLRETFFVGNFVETLPANGSRYVQRLYDQAREVEEAYGSFRARVKVGDAEGARRVLTEERDKIARYRQVEQFKRAESLISLQQRRVEEDPGLSADEKRQRLDSLQQRKNLLASQFPGV